MKFENRIAVIANCGTDVGLAIASRYRKEGVKVAIYIDDEKRLERFPELAADEDVLVIPVSVDEYAHPEPLAATAGKVLEHYGKVDILVTAITCDPSGSLETMTYEQYDKVIKTVANGTLWAIQPILYQMKVNGYGRIAILSSVGGRTSIPGVSPAFAAANAALGGMARNIGCTSGMQTVTANLIAVGPLEDGSYNVAAPGVIAPRATLANVAGAAAYLTADLASWTTGETLDLSGGYFML